MKSPLPPFTGFSHEMTQFFIELKHNNTREWFEKNKPRYIKYIKTPAQQFLQDMAERLVYLSPYITADPRRSIFRIHRDSRFAKNKAPYKEWLSLFFWEGPFAKNENPGFFISISVDQLSIGAGNYSMPREVLEKFREEITGPRANEFTKIVKNLKKKGYEISGKHYKRYPRGFSADDKNSEFLLYNSCFIMKKEELSELVYSADLIDYCMEKYSDCLELHKWLVELGKMAQTDKK